MKSVRLALLATLFIAASAHATTHIWQVQLPSVARDTQTQGSGTFSVQRSGPIFALNPATTRVVVVINGTYQAHQRAEAYTTPFTYGYAKAHAGLKWKIWPFSGPPATSNNPTFSPFGGPNSTFLGTSMSPLQSFFLSGLPRVDLDVSSFTAAQKASVTLQLEAWVTVNANGIANAQASLQVNTISNYVTLEYDATGRFLG